MSAIPVAMYPWSGMSGSLVAELMQGSEEEAHARALSRLVSTVWKGLPEETQRVGALNLRAMTAWLRGDRRVIRVSAQSMALLAEVATRRLGSGGWPARWFDLPRPGQALYAEPLVLCWEGIVRGSRPVMTFIRARGLPTEERIDYLHWEVAEGDTLWGTAPNLPFEMTTGEFSRVWESVTDMVLGRQDFVSDTDGHSTLPAQVKLLIHAVNMVAALNEPYELSLLRVHSGADKRGRSRLGGLKVHSFDLDETGLNVWSKRYVVLGPVPPAASPRKGGTHAAPAAHYRRDHTVRMWVNQARAGEIVLAEKEGKLLVRRPRRGGPVGSGEVSIKRERVRTGVDDIDGLRGGAT